jgi:hypothetical protein
MSKILKMKYLFGQQSLLAMSLAVALAAFGCTTDRTLGNGRPTDGSDVRTTPTGGAITGSETAQPLPPSMTSSYSRPEALPRVTRSIQRLSPDEAALIMAQQRPKYRVLGPVSPALSGNLYYSANLVTGQWQNPAMRTNPELTINSSLTSSPSTGVASDTAASTAALTAASSVLSNLSANVGATAPVFATPTSTGTSTTANASVPAVTTPASPTGAAAATRSSTSLVPTTATPTNASMTATRATAAGSPTPPVRVVTGAQSVTVTNQQH